SAYPALVMGALCMFGGVTGYIRRQSIPSLVAGISVGALYLYAGNSIRKNTAGGLETALGASAILFLSSAPRAFKAPVPAMLTVTSLASGGYYGNVFYNVRHR
ncbi:transmembrane proteins 14C-domain-containing protein, partial [Vararia minispora EC-137]